MTSTGARWWRSGVVYKIHPRSFADAGGDGVGDLEAIILLPDGRGSRSGVALLP